LTFVPDFFSVNQSTTSNLEGDVSLVEPPGLVQLHNSDAIVSSLSVLQLSSRCQNRQTDGSHEPFCLELFRRAITENCSLSWYCLYTHYYSLVRYWVRQYIGTTDTPDLLDDLVQETFARFHQSYTREKLACAKGLGDVLSYLKSCAASAAMQENRRAKRDSLVIDWDEETLDQHALSDSPETSVLREIDNHCIWAVVESCCHNEQDRMIVELVFITGLKPKQIVEQHPDLFSDVSEIYRIKRNLVDRIRRHPVWYGMRENGYDER